MYRDNLELLSPLAAIIKSQAELINAINNSLANKEQKKEVVANAVKLSRKITQEINYHIDND